MSPTYANELNKYVWPDWAIYLGLAAIGVWLVRAFVGKRTPPHGPARTIGAVHRPDSDIFKGIAASIFALYTLAWILTRVTPIAPLGFSIPDYDTTNRYQNINGIPHKNGRPLYPETHQQSKNESKRAAEATSGQGMALMIEQTNNPTISKPAVRWSELGGPTNTPICR